MNALKSSIFVYDLVTLPLYYIFQRPWRKRRRAKAIRATSSRENDPSSIWRPVGKAKQNITDNCDLVDAYFKRMVKIYGSKRCLGVRDTVHEEEEVQSDGKVFKKKILAPNYRWYTYSQIDKRIDDVTRGLLLSGVKPKEKVIIFAETRLEWMITFLALMRLGAVVSTLYATLGEESIIYGINQLQSSCIVTTSELLPKVKKILDKAPSLKLIINIEDNFSKSKNDYSKQVDNDNVTVVSFAELESKGSEASPDLKGEPHSPDDVALIMYTSGSTGVPKGVLITNKNVMATQKGCYLIGKDWKSSKEDAKYIAFLPLAHIMELTAELFFLSMGLGIGYSSPLTLSDRSPGIKQGSLGDIAVLRPAAMTGVPLVIEKIRKGVLDQVKARGKFFKQFFDFAIIYKSYWFEKGYNTPLLDFLLFRKIKAGFGGNLEVWLSGGAPLSPESQAFLRACLGVKMLLGYGATETCGGACISNLYDRSTGRVGAPLLGVYLKLIPWEEGNYNPTDKPNPRGEIIIGGDCVSLGYYKNDEQTKEDFWQDEHGIRWFKTGDIGELFPDGTLKIIDRRKDLIKLQQGEYVSLGKIETELKINEYVDNICVCGDSNHNYLIALIVPNRVKLQTLSKLSDSNESKLEFNELVNDSKVIDAVLSSIKITAIEAGLMKYEIPQKVKLCEEEWTPENGLITAAMKVRRKQIQEFYANDIKAMYSTDINANQNRMQNGSDNKQINIL